MKTRYQTSQQICRKIDTEREHVQSCDVTVQAGEPVSVVYAG